MALSNLPTSSRQSTIPTYSGFFQILIKVQGTETRLPKLVYFNKERGSFYQASTGDCEQKFSGPQNGLVVIGVVGDNGIVTFPNQGYKVCETIVPINATDFVSHNTNQALEIALAI